MIGNRIIYEILKFSSAFALYLICFVNSFAQQKKLPFKLIDSGFIFNDAPFESCHASTLVVLPGNKILAAWFGGKHEGNNNVAIWSSEKINNQWTKPVEIANGKQENGKQYPCWNPVLFRTKEGVLFLHYKVGSTPREWWAEMKISNDDGKSWSVAERLPDNFLGPIKNKPFQLKNGDILYPSSTESTTGNIWNIHLERSDSKGRNWKMIPIQGDSFGVIQPSILTYANGQMQLVCRSRQNAIVDTWSSDGGNTWSPLQKLNLPNPNSGSDAVTLQSGIQLLVYNPLASGKDWWEGRAVLKVAISTNGKDWKDVLVLEQHSKGEYSYPAVVQAVDGTIHISYTYERKKIKYVRLKLDPESPIR